ncbi:hypothetical protein CAEBREN_09200 [Caenorhabditis brenneri]|uniref:Ataxin-10 domain-containing protein n=1 Tax=Caenorhabditis brenneri TaxID=135651 RepID=G0MJ12_CAEBE|nr:hypothetical protein CAEBREN_09200 [Caenorhabditis brenneri]
MEQLLKDIVELGKNHKFDGSFDYGSEISSESLLEVMRFVGTDESSQEVLERFLEDAPIIHQTLLSMTLSSWIQQKQSPEPSIIKPRRCIRLLLNLIQRSTRFASKMPSECVDLLEALLASSQFDPECLLILLKTSDSTCLEFQKSSRYSYLLEQVLLKIHQNSQDDVATCLAYFSTLLEKDYGFLSSCYAEMSPKWFCEVLDVVRCLLEHKSTQQSLKIHSNNLLFVLNLLELMTVDYVAFLTAKSKKEPKSVEERRGKTIEMLNLLVEILGEMCTNTEMTSHLNEKATAMNAVVDVLDTILHSESLFADFRAAQPENWPKLPETDEKFKQLLEKIEEEKRYEETQRKYADRPKQPPPSKILRIEANESLAELAKVIFEQYQKIEDVHGIPRIGELKLNCLKAISNLCSLCPGNKLATLQNGRQGLLSVLQCTSRRPAYFMESYAMRNYSIFCVRQLTDECQENKEVILRLGEPQQPIIDRKRLLKEFGIDEQELKAVVV